MLGTLFTLPNTTTTLAGIAEWSTPFFADWKGIVFLIGGFFFGLMIVVFIVRFFTVRIR